MNFDEANLRRIIRDVENEDVFNKFVATATMAYIVILPIYLLVVSWRNDFNGDSNITISDIFIWIQTAFSEPFFFLRDLLPTVSRFLELSTDSDPTLVTFLVGFALVVASDILLFMLALETGNGLATKRYVAADARRKIAANELLRSTEQENKNILSDIHQSKNHRSDIVSDD
jgi:hypothetical protein